MGADEAMTGVLGSTASVAKMNGSFDRYMMRMAILVIGHRGLIEARTGYIQEYLQIECSVTLICNSVVSLHARESHQLSRPEQLPYFYTPRASTPTLPDRQKPRATRWPEAADGRRPGAGLHPHAR
jgi:hypothetical protein